MAKIERKSALAKAPAIDVVTALTVGAADAATREAPAPAEATVPSQSHDAAVTETGVAAPSESVTEAVGDDTPVLIRRGPGRPRTRRRMEPISSKIDIELRDQVDAYIAEHDTTFVDLLDEALRARIAR